MNFRPNRPGSQEILRLAKSLQVDVMPGGTTVARGTETLRRLLAIEFGNFTKSLDRSRTLQILILTPLMVLVGRFGQEASGCVGISQFTAQKGRGTLANDQCRDCTSLDQCRWEV
jgi:hypothetical protein